MGSETISPNKVPDIEGRLVLPRLLDTLVSHPPRLKVVEWENDVQRHSDWWWEKMTPSSASRVPQSPAEKASGTRLTRGWPWHRHQHWRADGIGTRELPQQRCDGRRERGGAELDRWHLVGLLSQEWLVLSCGSSFALLKLNCNWEKKGKSG
ncbi:hypothetical protein ABZX51_007210 [Aspergillus tubingensis]